MLFCWFKGKLGKTNFLHLPKSYSKKFPGGLEMLFFQKGGEILDVDLIQLQIFPLLSEFCFCWGYKHKINQFPATGKKKSFSGNFPTRGNSRLIFEKVPC